MQNVVSAVMAVWLVVVLGSCRSMNQSKVSDNQAVDAAHNSKNSVNWAGAYTGVIPGADSPGIGVQITLYYNETYTITYHYIGNSDNTVTFTGTFTWDDRGSTIMLDGKAAPLHYKVGENVLIPLDMEGNAVTDVLKKVPHR